LLYVKLVHIACGNLFILPFLLKETVILLVSTSKRGIDIFSGANIGCTLVKDGTTWTSI